MLEDVSVPIAFGRGSDREPTRFRQSWSLCLDGQSVVVERLWSTDDSGLLQSDVRAGWVEHRPLSQLELRDVFSRLAIV
jgi:hypothetical protein